MKRGRWAVFAASAGAFGGSLLEVQALGGCHSAVSNDGLVDAKQPPQPDAGPPPTEEVGTNETKCDKSAGVVPAADCFDGLVSCKGDSACQIAKSCGGSFCLPMTTNKAPIYNFRMENLHIVAPSALANAAFQNSMILPAVTLDDPSGKCGYGPDTGFAGTFNWLLSLNTETKMLTTGGGGPVDDPYKTGYCFVNGALGGVSIAPLTVPVILNGVSFSTVPAESVVNIPVFARRADLSTSIVLPIQGLRFKGVGMTPDGSCIGAINSLWVSTAGEACNPRPSPSCPKWFNEGSLAGHVPLKDADVVGVPNLFTSLCHLLIGGDGEVCTNSLGAKYRCCTPGDMTLGDYCSSGDSCSDSDWFSATFAANAVKINDSTAPPCGP
jgi:hypothetical protein